MVIPSEYMVYFGSNNQTTAALNLAAVFISTENGAS